MSSAGGASSIASPPRYSNRGRGVHMRAPPPPPPPPPSQPPIHAQPDTFSDDSLGLDAIDTLNSTTSSSPRHVRFLPDPSDNVSGSSSAIQSLTSASTLSNLETKLDLSPYENNSRTDLLRDSFFDQWKDDAARLDSANPEEMQKQDPLGAQIWRLYHKTKTQLPNSERLENLTWRMMSMNLRRKELERRG